MKVSIQRRFLTFPSNISQEKRDFLRQKLTSNAVSFNKIKIYFFLKKSKHSIIHEHYNYTGLVVMLCENLTLDAA